MEMELCYIYTSWDLNGSSVKCCLHKNAIPSPGYPLFSWRTQIEKTSGFKCQKSHHFNIWIFSKKAVTGHRLKNKKEITVAI